MSFRYRFGWALVIALAMVVLTSCKVDPARALIGRWRFARVDKAFVRDTPVPVEELQNVDQYIEHYCDEGDFSCRLGLVSANQMLDALQDSEYEFYEDGIMKLTYSDLLLGKMTIIGRYRLLDSRQVMLEYPPSLLTLFMSKQHILGFRRAGDYLFLAMEEGDAKMEVRYVRVRE